jgi:hypothetical protein
MTIPVRSRQHPFAGTSRSRRRANFIPAPARAAGHHGPVPNQAVEYRSNTQSAIISGFQLSEFLGKPSLAKAAPTSNLHRRPTPHRCPAGSFFRGLSDVVDGLQLGAPRYWVTLRGGS